MKIENVMNMNAGELNHADDEAVTFQSGAVSAWIGKFSFNGKMRILLLCITILTLAGNWLTADLVHNEIREGANKRGNSSRLTQSFHFFMFEPIFSPVNASNQPI